MHRNVCCVEEVATVFVDILQTIDSLNMLNNPGGT